MYYIYVLYYITVFIFYLYAINLKFLEYSRTLTINHVLYNNILYIISHDYSIIGAKSVNITLVTLWDYEIMTIFNRGFNY